MNGFLLVDKPPHITSYDVIRRLKKIFQTKKIGHTGTLDPFATGLMVIGFGFSLKMINYLVEEPKVYEAVLKLGTQTDTGDCDGQPTGRQQVPRQDPELLLATFKQFLGTSHQIPPMYSAKKVNGQKLYEIARKGEVIERQLHEIFISSIDLLSHTEDEIRFRVACSKGTYIRVLGEDIAKRLGIVGHLISLRRIQSGSFDIKNAHQLESIDSKDFPLIGPDECLSHLPKFQGNIEDSRRLLMGQKLPFTTLSEGSVVRLFTADATFMGLGLVKEGLLCPKKILHQSFID